MTTLTPRTGAASYTTWWDSLDRPVRVRRLLHRRSQVPQGGL